MQTHEAPVLRAPRVPRVPLARVPRDPIDTVRHIAQLLLMAEPGTAAAIAVRSRWAADLATAADALEGTPLSIEAAEQARIALEQARQAVWHGMGVISDDLAQRGVSTLIDGTDMFAHHAGEIPLPDGRTLRFEGTLEVQE
jgi:hypothetical protein